MDYSPSYEDDWIRAYQNNSITENKEDYYKNFVDEVIPRTPELAYYYGLPQYYGALDSRIDEYLIMLLNSYAISNPMLNTMIKGSLKTTTMMGYYSEWSGYGSTRLAPPEQRTLEYEPISWEQVDYPGPSLGYRALRIYEFQ